MTRTDRPASRGFALAAVLWMLAGLAILIAMVSGAATSSAERVAQLRQRADFMTAAYGARARLLYWASVTNTSTASFNDGAQHVRADATRYEMAGGSTLALQDIGGLISLNKPDVVVLLRYLEACGVPQDAAPFLVDALLDYVDDDDLHRINGAERAAYSARQLAGPRNAPLRSVEELWAVYGWSEWKAVLQKNDCARDLTVEVSAQSTVNLATAPAAILAAAGLPAEAVASLTQARVDANTLSTQLQTANAIAGNRSLLGFSSGGQVERKLAVVQAQPDNPLTFEYTLLLTGQSEDGPWKIIQPRWSARPAPMAGLKPDAPAPAPSVPWPGSPPAAQSSNAANPLPF